MTRINLGDQPAGDTLVSWPVLTVVPHWNWRGHADYGTMGDGGRITCLTPASSRCVGVAWSGRETALIHQPKDVAWWGTVLRDKADGTGTLFRRNRYVDPATGRFTQEDPIGLAGGLNLYGFAGGDPVTFSDPFGLSVCVSGGTGAAIARIKRAIGDATDTDITWTRNHCVQRFKSRGNAAFRNIRQGFLAMVRSTQTFSAALEGPSGSPQTSPTRISVQADIESHVYFTGAWGQCDGGTEAFAMGQIFAHELIHHIPVAHGQQLPAATSAEEANAIQNGDNVYNSQRGKMQRCNHFGQ